MCGIVGYIGKNNIKDILLDGLGELEYRGYDSCGVAILSNQEIEIRKNIGSVDEVNSIEHLSIERICT